MIKVKRILEKMKVVILTAFFMLGIHFVDAQVPAFPGAEGFGRYTTGGRGGVVYEVTNLNDAGPGSLRAAVEASGARTVVFRVSGTIELQSVLRLNNDNITIAGQTAPGDGICLKNYTFRLNANNVIIRFIRFRLGDESDQEDDPIWGRERSNIIIDHCSMSWSTDEAGSFYDNTNFTLQWCLLSESLYQSIHDKGNHGYGGIWGGMGATFHHNLLAHHGSRNPRFNGSRYHGVPANEIVDYRNNVIFNWGFNSAYGGEAGNHNIVANYYKPGPATNSGVMDRIMNPDANANGYGFYYIEDNVVHGRPNPTNDNWLYGVQGVSSAVKDQIRLPAPNQAPAITEHVAAEAFEHVLARVGAILPKRDPVDERIVNETLTGTTQYGGAWGEGRGIIDTQSTVGGWPTLNSTTAPVDTDGDGMPDDWEIANGLDPEDPSDRNDDMHGLGYTNLEYYLNSLVEDFEYLLRPINVQIDTVIDKQVTISWADISDNETGFVIERSSGDGFEVINTLAANTTTYIDNDITEFGGYGYRLKAINENMESFYTDSIGVNIFDPTSINEVIADTKVNLDIYPNPIRSHAFITYDLPHDSHVTLSIFDMNGKEVRQIVNVRQSRGSYSYEIINEGLNGIYFLRLQTGNSIHVKKIVGIK